MRDWKDYEDEFGYVRIRFRLLSTEEGGRSRPVHSDYRASWDIGNTYNGEWTLNDAPLVFEEVEVLQPGQEATARIHPIAREFWSNVRSGLTIHAHEGRRRVGSALVLQIVTPNAE